jgi:hypothetical protein
MGKTKDIPTSWLYSRQAYFAGFVITLILAYGLASLAIDSGRWLHYLLTFAAISLAIKFLSHFVKYGKS